MLKIIKKLFKKRGEKYGRYKRFVFVYSRTRKKRRWEMGKKINREPKPWLKF